MLAQSPMNQSKFTNEEIEVMNNAVFYHPTLENVIVFKQIENPTVESYGYMLDILTNLAEKLDYHYTLSDLSLIKGKYSKDMRDFAKNYMKGHRNPSLHIASVIDVNILMKLMTKFMAGVKPSFSFSIHKTLEEAEQKIADLIEKREAESTS